ncbi:MAG TPA: tetratricopeptide repeat protein [Bryobacteraceae bacterium]|nr:tetratricopeptide repeat protein [Bryobacteraceae bacterium]
MRTAWLLCLLMEAACVVRAQSPASFEELAQRAQAAVDSNPAEAVTLFKEGLALRPSWAEGWFYLGGALYHLNRNQEACDALRKVTALVPDKGVAWGLLGLAEYELGDFDQALADLKKGETLQLGGSQEFEIAVRLDAARILIHATAFYEAASTELRPLVVQFQAGSPAVIEALGLCALAMPRLPSEVPALKRAVVNLAGKALWANLSKRPIEAASSYRELLEKFPHEPGVHYANGMYLVDSDPRGALTEFEKELQADPAHWPSLLFSAMLELKKGDPETSIQMAERALKVVPERHRPLCRAELGSALLALGRIEEAIPELEAAAKLDPANSRPHFYLQKAYRLAGRKADADREGAEFLRLKAEEDPLGLPNPSGDFTDAAR